MAGGSVEILCCDTDRLTLSSAELAQTLTDDELRRAERFRFPELSRRYLTGRYVLRKSLEARTGRKANTIRFDLERRGKPYISGGPSFNLADSKSLVLIGIAGEGNLGVDLEHVVASADLAGIAQNHFAAEESAALTRLSDSERVRGFYRIWTRKEALLKALGMGLSGPLDSFAVSADEQGGNALLRGDGDLSPGRWFVQSIVVGTQCEAAIAWDRYPSSIEIRHFPEPA